MSPFGSRLAAYLLAPEPRLAPGPASPPASVDGPAAARTRAGRPSGRRRPVARAAPLAAAVLGDGGAAALAMDVAGVLAQRARVRVAVVAVWGAPVGPPRGSATQATAQLAAEVQAAVGVTADAGGHDVLVELPLEAGTAATVLGALPAAVAGDAPIVLAVCGPWPPALRPALRQQELLVGTLAADAPPGLHEHAAASLRAVAPAACSVVVARASSGLPRALRNRPALRQIVEALDA